MQTVKRDPQPCDVPIFGAEDLRRIERINAEIDRNGRRRDPADLPLFGDEKGEG